MFIKVVLLPSKLVVLTNKARLVSNWIILTVSLSLAFFVPLIEEIPRLVL